MVFPGLGATIMAIGIMISTFGCTNGLILAGARAYYAMARDRRVLSIRRRLERRQGARRGAGAAGRVGRVSRPAADVRPGRRAAYGNLYSNLLDYVISAALIFYILTIAGVFRLRQHAPGCRPPVSHRRLSRWCRPSTSSARS